MEVNRTWSVDNRTGGMRYRMVASIGGETVVAEYAQDPKSLDARCEPPHAIERRLRGFILNHIREELFHD